MMLRTQTRRQFLGVSAGALLTSPRLAGAMADIRVGITVDTRPDWNGPENFLRSIIEASQVGYRYVETFWDYVERWENNPQELKEILLALGMRMETVSNGGRMNMTFYDPMQRKQCLEDHQRLVKFIQYFDCDHLKINTGPRPKGGHTSETYKNMCETFTQLGSWMLDETGIKLGVHLHLESMFESPQDLKVVMESTDPKIVHFIHDTHQTTMAGMDPVELTRQLASRTLEYHLKDAPREAKGGFKGKPDSPGGLSPAGRSTFELGESGGVDFPEILFILNRTNWKGWFTVELNWTQSSCKHSAMVSKKYVEEVLSLRL